MVERGTRADESELVGRNREAPGFSSDYVTLPNRATTNSVESTRWR